jgi:signal transduction histidine kinase
MEGRASRSADLRSLLRDAAHSIATAAASKKLRLETILPEAPLFVDIDEDRFQQVVLNLLGNAVKYTPQGGTIWVKATADGGEVLVKVQDTGIGIAPEMLRASSSCSPRRTSGRLGARRLGRRAAVVRQR